MICTPPPLFLQLASRILVIQPTHSKVSRPAALWAALRIQIADVPSDDAVPK